MAPDYHLRADGQPASKTALDQLVHAFRHTASGILQLVPAFVDVREPAEIIVAEIGRSGRHGHLQHFVVA